MKSEGHVYPAGSVLILKQDKIDGIIESGVIPAEVKNSKGTRYYDMSGQVVMPGFIEPHAHLSLSVMLEAVQDLSPCLPEPFQRQLQQDFPLRAQCTNFIDEALSQLAGTERLRNTGWFLGNGLDPSRMRYSNGQDERSSKAFMDYPSEFLNDFSDGDHSAPFTRTPVFILDQSGHLAYVNRLAFQTLGLCTDTQPCQGSRESVEQLVAEATEKYHFSDGEWGIHCNVDESNCTLSGLLKEESAFAPFLEQIEQQSSVNVARALLRHTGPDALEQAEITRMREMLNIASRAGLTTFVEGGGSSAAMIDSYKALYHNNQPPVRMRVLYTWNAKPADNAALYTPDQPAQWVLEQGPTPWNDDNDGMLTAAGIKLWSDGSTQGCSAALQQDYAKGDQALCAKFNKGHTNYEANQIAANLRPFWSQGWYVNIHANGDQAIINSIDALTLLADEQQQSTAMGQPLTADLPHTLIHATVNIDDSQQQSGERSTIDAIVKARENTLKNLSTSHLIGHVAYWGKAMENELGPQRGQFIDPAKTEWNHNIPVSLHSDLPITPLYPLWFVEQAITRETWQYPHLSESDRLTLNKAQALNRYQALMAVTINPAKQHRLDDKIGTLEVDKIADLVVLNSNPLTEARHKIHSIKVACTFINGRPTRTNKQGGCAPVN
ncbi:amidohydrolase [Ferrimonas sp. SCSIO 43195]|uniref:amidohydrolase n=1 Tax=Ferrimonas sp. SCSIO 43195 TaxID=2822844 RepID=UPI002074CB22|nr:amidohydrolase family protein [Ferrimonas sp. SCSIO 43195]